MTDLSDDDRRILDEEARAMREAALQGHPSSNPELGNPILVLFPQDEGNLGQFLEQSRWYRGGKIVGAGVVIAVCVISWLLVLVFAFALFDLLKWLVKIA